MIVYSLLVYRRELIENFGFGRFLYIAGIQYCQPFVAELLHRFDTYDGELNLLCDLDKKDMGPSGDKSHALSFDGMTALWDVEREDEVISSIDRLFPQLPSNSKLESTQVKENPQALSGIEGNVMVQQQKQTTLFRTPIVTRCTADRKLGPQLKSPFVDPFGWNRNVDNNQFLKVGPYAVRKKLANQLHMHLPMAVINTAVQALKQECEYKAPTRSWLIPLVETDEILNDKMQCMGQMKMYNVRNDYMEDSVQKVAKVLVPLYENEKRQFSLLVIDMRQDSGDMGSGPMGWINNRQ
ncbi:hypothetical protein GH714_002222 [Hevea brasiliensis]|uniref:Uncharacterized protein n=1 Tax=Hevea brasiliensis TaxID=3981 RepID=A0A6A6KQ98_HEVBR|nr:hypothetical protein GH714_002222 [Hevea brasiliensis]